ncbi:MAG: hypothetical protein QW692_01975 [Nitrososphaerota archaeon]
MKWKLIKVSEDVYSFLENVKREKGLSSMNAAVKSILQAQQEEPAPKWLSEVKAEIAEIKAMISRLHALEAAYSEEPDAEDVKALGSCPHCKSRLDNRRIFTENRLIAYPGIEIRYIPCPSCGLPLTKLKWQKAQIPQK